VRITSLGRTRGRTHGHAAEDVVAWHAACRERRSERMTVTVVRRSGDGPFTLRVTFAG
jgi:hypothetical protein